MTRLILSRSLLQRQKAGEIYALYKITKTLSGSCSESSNVPVKDKEGKVISYKKEISFQVESWRRTVERDMTEQGWTWGYLEGQAQEQSQCFSLEDAFCTVGEDNGNLTENPQVCTMRTK